MPYMAYIGLHVINHYDYSTINLIIVNNLPNILVVAIKFTCVALGIKNNFFSTHNVKKVGQH